MNKEELEVRKAYLREVFGEEKFERMLKDAKEFFTLNTKKSRKQLKEATKKEAKHDST